MLEGLRLVPLTLGLLWRLFVPSWEAFRLIVIPSLSTSVSEIAKKYLDFCFAVL